MKRDWNRPNLNAAYKPVPKAFEQTVSETLHSLETDHRVIPVQGGRTRRIMLAAAVTVLLLASALAYAVARPAILNWLLGQEDASQALEQSAQTIIAENSADHITVRINSLVWDGERFAVSYEVENDQPDQPAMIVVDSHLSVNDQPEGLQSTAGGTADPQMVPSPRLDVLPVRRNPADGGAWSLPLRQELDGDAVCEINFLVYRPIKGFVVITSPEEGFYHLDDYDEDAQAELLDAWNTLNGFQLSALEPGDEKDVQRWVDEGYTVINSSGMILGDYDNNALLYNMQATGQIPVTFEFDAIASDVYDASDMADISLPDCTVRIHRLRFSPLTTVIDLSLLPETNSREAAQELVSRYGAMTLLDEQGEPVTYASMDYLYNQDPWVTEHWHEQEHWACTYLIEMPGLQTWPESIRLVTEEGELLRLTLSKHFTENRKPFSKNQKPKTQNPYPLPLSSTTRFNSPISISDSSPLYCSSRTCMALTEPSRMA